MGFLPKYGNYRKLKAYRGAEFVYDLTYIFTQRFLSSRDRTVDQMIQAARSGKQNIAEGSKASGTSKEMEIKLMNVARASLEELLVDYDDFLRTRNLEKWEKDSSYACKIRELNRSESTTFEVFRPFAEQRSAGTVANIAICLIHQTNYLLDMLIRKLEQDFVKEGGIRERMTKARLEHRGRA